MTWRAFLHAGNYLMMENEMGFKNTDLPDSTKMTLTFTLRQIKTLDYAINKLLDEVEKGLSNYPEKPLQRLCDVFWPILHVERSEAEEKEHMRQWHIKIAEQHLAWADKQQSSDMAVQP